MFEYALYDVFENWLGNVMAGTVDLALQAHDRAVRAEFVRFKVS